MDICQSCKSEITLSDARLVRIDSFKTDGLYEIVNRIICKYCVSKVIDVMIEIAQEADDKVKKSVGCDDDEES